jgi:hypothetical protein
MQQNEQGLYSVKNASIQFNISHNRSMNNYAKPNLMVKGYDIYTEQANLNHYKSTINNQNELFNIDYGHMNNEYKINMNNNESLYMDRNSRIENVNNILQIAQQQQQFQIQNLQPNKTNSLRKIKKELEYRKNSNIMYSNSNLNNNNNLILSNQSSPNQNSIDNNSNPYHYLSREILLSPNEIIASVV